MNIPEEIIKSGRVVLYNDSDKQLENAISEYNRQMGEGRMKAKRLDEMKFGYLVINPLVTCGIIAAEAVTVFSSPVLGLIILLINIVAYVFFALIKGSYLISTIATALFIVLDWKFAFLFGADILIYFMHRHAERQLKNSLGYPVFGDISVRYERGNAPVYSDFDNDRG